MPFELPFHDMLTDWPSWVVLGLVFLLSIAHVAITSWVRASIETKMRLQIEADFKKTHNVNASPINEASTSRESGSLLMIGLKARRITDYFNFTHLHLD